MIIDRHVSPALARRIEESGDARLWVREMEDVTVVLRAHGAHLSASEETRVRGLVAADDAEPFAPTSPVRVHYSTGRIVRHDSLGAALAAIRETHEDAVAYHEDGREVTGSARIRGTARVLVWEDEESSEDDDGARAIASIRLA